MKKITIIMILLASIAAQSQTYSKSTTILRKQNFSVSAHIIEADTLIMITARNAKYKQLIDYFEVYSDNPTEMQVFLNACMNFIDTASDDDRMQIGEVSCGIAKMIGGRGIDIRVGHAWTAITKKNLSKISEAIEKWEK